MAKSIKLTDDISIDSDGVSHGHDSLSSILNQLDSSIDELKSYVDTQLDTKVSKSGDTMTGSLTLKKTSYCRKGAIPAVFQADSSTIPNLINEVRYENGCMGSANLASYTVGSVTIPATWYNFLYIPHRFGGKDGAQSGDNGNYGTLLLFNMTGDNSNSFIVRYSSSSITQARKI